MRVFLADGSVALFPDGLTVRDDSVVGSGRGYRLECAGGALPGGGPG